MAKMLVMKFLISKIEKMKYQIFLKADKWRFYFIKNFKKWKINSRPYLIIILLPYKSEMNYYLVKILDHLQFDLKIIFHLYINTSPFCMGTSLFASFPFLTNAKQEFLSRIFLFLEFPFSWVSFFQFFPFIIFHVSLKKFL